MINHVLVVGLGSIGKRHARNFRQLGVSHVSGMDPSPERRKEFTEAIAGKTFANLTDALCTRPDLVVIASPNIFHLPQALEVARHNLPMFIEKPLGTDAKLAQMLLKEVQQRNLFVHVGSNWKFHPAFEYMKKTLSEGRLGKIVAAQVLAGQWLPDWHPWEDFRRGYSARRDLGGGAIMDTHELDYLVWLLGPPKEFVGMWVQGTDVLPIETEHTAVAIMRMDNGALVTLQTDYIQRTPQRRYFITGTAGSMEWDLRKQSITIYGPEGIHERIDVTLEDPNEMYLQQSRHILEALKNRKQPRTSLKHMVGILELQLAWQKQKHVDSTWLVKGT